MKIMLSCGPNTRKVIATIAKLADGIDYYYHKNVKEFIRESKTRKMSFNRIIFSDSFLSKKPENDFKDLSNFLKDFADASEVILVLKESTPALEEKFLAVFNSPLYTVAYMPRPTPNALIDLVKEPMPTVKARYYELDKGNSKENTINQGVETDVVSSVKEQEVSTKSTYTESTTKDDTTDAGESAINSSIDPYSTDPYANPNESIVSDEKGDSLNYGNTENSGFSEDSPNSGSGFSEDDEDDDLSVGSFGSSHEDTGVFDEEEEDEELQEHLANIQRQEQEEHSNQEVKDGVVEEGHQEDNSQEYDEEQIEQEEVEEYHQPYTPVVVHQETNGSNVVLVIGLNGAGATQWIIDKAVSGAERGKSILIVDLDYLANGILSFIDTEAFYNGGHQSGKVYVEDGVSVISHGYGCEVSPAFFKNIKRQFNNYDLVFIDCPVECLHILDSENIDSYKKFICSLSDISKIIEFSNKVTNRVYTSIQTEVALMQPDKVIYTNGTPSDEDLDYVRSLLFMPNGYWFS